MYLVFLSGLSQLGINEMSVFNCRVLSPSRRFRKRRSRAGKPFLTGSDRRLRKYWERKKNLIFLPANTQTLSLECVWPPSPPPFCERHLTSSGGGERGFLGSGVCQPVCLKRFKSTLVGRTHDEVGGAWWDTKVVTRSFQCFFFLKGFWNNRRIWNPKWTVLHRTERKGGGGEPSCSPSLPPRTSLLLPCFLDSTTFPALPSFPSSSSSSHAGGGSSSFPPRLCPVVFLVRTFEV